MRIIRSNLKPVVAALVAIATMSLPAFAQSKTSELIKQLGQADKAGAVKIERALQLEWSKSGSAALDLLLRRGQSALNIGDVEAAIDHLTALTDHAPEFAHGWYMRATAYAEAALFGPALQDLERALALDPQHYEAIFSLGTLMALFERIDLAQKAFDEVRALHPYHQEAIQALKQLQLLEHERSL